MVDARSLGALLRRVQERTGAPLGECKKALDAAGGDVAQALNQLAASGFTAGRPPYDPAERGTYAFDAFGGRVVEACTSALAEYLPRGGAGLTAILLRSHHGIQVSLVSAHAGAGGRASAPVTEVDVAPDLGLIPRDAGAEDRLLQSFRYRHGLQATRPDVGLWDEDPPLLWEPSSLPASLYCYEMLLCAREIQADAARRGFAVSPGCTAAYAFGDYLVEDPERQLQDVLKSIRRHLPGERAPQDFAELCYQSPEKQRWLVAAAAAGPG